MEAKCIDLFVSELFRSFGDNNFVGEILLTCVELFSKRSRDGFSLCTSIPESYTTYICAIHSKKLHQYFSENPSEQLHVLGLPRDALFLTEIVPVYSMSCTTKKENTTHKVVLPLDQNNKHMALTGLAGYFRAKLFGELYIDTRPTLKQNTYFWESAFFPMLGSTPLGENDSNEVTFSVSRKCEAVKSHHILNVQYPQLKLWYEWAHCDRGASELKVCNADGKQHMLYL